MGKGKKETTALWVTLSRAGLLSLTVYFLGLLGLSALVVRGSVGEEWRFAAVAGLIFFSALLGGIAVGNATPWSGMMSGGIAAVVFVCALGIAGYAFWGQISLMGEGGILVVCALAGGILSGVIRGKHKRKGKRMRR